MRGIQLYILLIIVITIRCHCFPTTAQYEHTSQKLPHSKQEANEKLYCQDCTVDSGRLYKLMAVGFEMDDAWTFRAESNNSKLKIFH